MKEWPPSFRINSSLSFSEVPSERFQSPGDELRRRPVGQERLRSRARTPTAVVTPGDQRKSYTQQPLNGDEEEHTCEDRNASSDMQEVHGAGVLLLGCSLT